MRSLVNEKEILTTPCPQSLGENVSIDLQSGCSRCVFYESSVSTEGSKEKPLSSSICDIRTKLQRSNKEIILDTL